ncbi:RNA polymerase sigma factor [Sphingomonas glacialis]|nr:RNA polymerase sigma factor [Sphingomonas glacialis]
MNQLGDHGDEVLLRAAFQFRAALIHYFRRKHADPNELEDLAQEVFVRIAARRSAEPVANVGAYVFQTAASVLGDRHRRRVVRHAEDHVAFDSARHAEFDIDASRIVEARQDLRAAVDLLGMLPERTRIVFELRRFDGHPYADIAIKLGISVSAVEKHMLRATRRLLSFAQEAK